MEPTNKNYISKRFETRNQWLKARWIGGSDAAVIVGQSPWSSKIELYRRLVLDEDIIDNDSEAMALGRALEPLIRSEFREDFKDEYEVIDPIDYTLYWRTDKPYMTATIDGTLIDKETGDKGILEIKTHDVRSMEDAMMWKDGQIPMQYLFQLIHYFAVLTDYKFARIVPRLRYFNWNGDGKELVKTETLTALKLYRFEAQKQIDWLERKETDFFENNVLKLIPPQPEIKGL